MKTQAKSSKTAEPPRRKRRVTEVEVEEPVRRKKRQTTAVAVRGQGTEVVPARKKISKLRNVAKLRSIIGDSADDIQGLLEDGDNDSAGALIYKRMLQTLVDVIPYAEANVRKTRGAKGVYQINSLITSIREVLIDVQSMKDKGTLAANMIDRYLRPSYLDIGMSIVSEFSVLEAEARSSMSSEEFKAFKASLVRARGNIADTIQKEFGKVREDCIQYMQT